MSAPTSIREVLDRITTNQHEYRVVEYLVECLRPFVDMDVGRRRTLESEGCLVPFVPQEVVIGKIRWLAKELTAIQTNIDELQGAAIAPPIQQLPPPPAPEATPAPVARAPRKPRAVPTQAAPTHEPKKKGRKPNEEPVRTEPPTATPGPRRGGRAAAARG